MRFGEYLRGRPVLMVSPLPPAELAARINAEADSIFNPIGVGVIGHVRLGRLHLHRRAWVSYHRAMKPALTGAVCANGTGSRLRLRYGAPFLFFLSVPMVFFLAGYTMWILGTPRLPLFFAYFLAAFLGMKLLSAAWALRGAEADLSALIEFLEETAEARRADLMQ